MRKVSPSGTITTVAGNGVCDPIFTGEGALATTTSLSTVYSVAVDAVGNLYLCDQYTVRKVSTNGIITTFAGNNFVARLFRDRRPGNQGDPRYTLGPCAGQTRQSSTSRTLPTTWSSRFPRAPSLRVAGNGVSGYSGDGGQGEIGQNLNSPVAVAVGQFRQSLYRGWQQFSSRPQAPQCRLTESSPRWPARGLEATSRSWVVRPRPRRRARRVRTWYNCGFRRQSLHRGRRSGAHSARGVHQRPDRQHGRKRHGRLGQPRNDNRLLL